RAMLYGVSGENPTVPDLIVRPGKGFLGEVNIPEQLPDWITEADLDFYTAEYERTGFRGGLNWYRNLGRNWEQTAPWAGAKVVVRALYVVGDRDPVYHFPGAGPQMVNNLPNLIPNLKQSVVLEGCGHWTQQERAAEVNRLLLEFLRSL